MARVVAMDNARAMLAMVGTYVILVRMDIMKNHEMIPIPSVNVRYTFCYCFEEVTFIVFLIIVSLYSHALDLLIETVITCEA